MASEIPQTQTTVAHSKSEKEHAYSCDANAHHMNAQNVGHTGLAEHHTSEAHHHHTHAQDQSHIGGHHLLQVEDLTISFRMYDDTPEGGLAKFFNASRRIVQTVRDLSISVHGGEIIAVVGASGSGKTLLADSILGIFEPNSMVTGTIWFDGEKQTADSLEHLRGCGISFVPQSINALDPLMRVGKQVRGFSANEKDRHLKQRELFERYGLAPEVERMFPFELSGGMARRVLLCCALMDDPKLIIADEPTPGLNEELAKQVMQDFRNFANEGGGVLLITHDIEFALHTADRIAVFKDGTVVEETSAAAFASPDMLEHPFSRELWHALPEHGFVLSDEVIVDA